MTETMKATLEISHAIEPNKIIVIPHGVPDIYIDPSMQRGGGGVTDGGRSNGAGGGPEGEDAGGSPEGVIKRLQGTSEQWYPERLLIMTNGRIHGFKGIGTYSVYTNQ